MAWNPRNNDGFPFGEGNASWRGNFWASPGVDRAPGAPTPQEAFENWFSRFQEGGSFGGPHGGPPGGRGPWTAHMPFMPQRGGFWGHHGRRGGRRAQSGPAPAPAPDSDNAGEGSSRDAQPTATAANDNTDPPTSTPDLLSDDLPSPPPHPPHHHHHQPPPYPGRPHRGGARGRGGHHGCRGQAPPYHPESPAHNPWAETFHSLANAIFPNAAANASDQASDEAPFTPPLDLFATPSSYVLHLALPGAKKSDIGIDWDHDTSTLRVAGVIHRPGDEALLASLLPTTAERRVGYFERLVKLPPRETAEQTRRWRNVRPRGTRVGEEADPMDIEDDEGREEIDAAGITAHMEDGVLVVTVPKAEREWTQITKIEVD